MARALRLEALTFPSCPARATHFPFPSADAPMPLSSPKGPSTPYYGTLGPFWVPKPRVQVLLIMGLWGLFGYQNPGSKYSLLWDFGAFLGTKTQGPSTPYYGTLGPFWVPKPRVQVLLIMGLWGLFGYQNPGSKYSLLWDFGAFLGTKTQGPSTPYYGTLGPFWVPKPINQDYLDP